MTYPPVVLRGREAEFLPTIEHVLLADSSSTDGALTSHRVRLSRGALGARPHHHRRGSELFFVVDGRLDVLIGAEIHEAGAGDVVIVPPASSHAFAAHAGHTADALIVLTPGVERFEYFRQVEAIRDGRGDPAALEAQQMRFDTFFDDSARWSTHLDERNR